MQVLLTTSQSLLLLDTGSGAAHVLDHGAGLYYGLACDGEQIYVAARRRLVSSSVPQGEERGEILLFDRQLRRRGTLQAPFPLRDLHEIAWHDGKLYATCSYDNMVAVFDGQRWEEWYPLGKPAPAEAAHGHASGHGDSDLNHFNSLMFESGRIWVLAHNRGPSELLAFSLPGREHVETIALGNCGHNIWREQGQLMSCSSAEGRIVGVQGFKLDTGGFPRGIASDASTRCVGVSALSERKERDLNTGKLLVMAPNWTPRHQIELVGEGLVLDLLPLPAGFALPTPSWWRRAFGAAGAAPRVQFPLVSPT